MKRESCIKLLELLKKYELDFSSINTEQLFNLNEEVVNELLKNTNKYQLQKLLEYLTNHLTEEEKNDIEYQKKICNIISVAQEEYKIALMIKTLKILNKHKDLALNILKKCNTELITKKTFSVLTNTKLIEKNISILSASKLTECFSEEKVELMEKVLTNKDCIEANMEQMAADIILESDDLEVATIISNVFCNRMLLKNMTVSPIIKKISNCKQIFQLKELNSVLENYKFDKILDGEVEIELVDAFLKSEKKYQSKTLKQILKQKTLLKNKNIFKVIPFINIAKDELQANCMYNIVISTNNNKIMISDEDIIDVITQLENMTDYTYFDSENVEDLRINEALFILNNDEFDLVNDINSEVVSECIKKLEKKKIYKKN